MNKFEKFKLNFKYFNLMINKIKLLIVYVKAQDPVGHLSVTIRMRMKTKLKLITQVAVGLIATMQTLTNLLKIRLITPLNKQKPIYHKVQQNRCY